MSEWTCDSNQALSLSLIRPRADADEIPEEDPLSQTFEPAFTYPIFGEDEKIYGYKDLLIDLRFASGSLVPYLGITYSSKLQTTTVDDIDAKLSLSMPEFYYKDESLFEERVEQDATSFKPLGEKVYEYTKFNRMAGPTAVKDDDLVSYEVYHTTWATPGFREFHRRMQIFILLYIEGGSYINEDEDSWEFVTLFERRRRKSDSSVVTYHFVGYSSLYNFYCYPDKVRMRLSQFVILPIYQRHGHGSALYQAIYKLVVSRNDIAELTVEDPAEAFEELRDLNDVILLLDNSAFMAEAFGESESHQGGRVNKGKGKAKAKRRIGPPTERAWADQWRRSLKLAARQFQRLVEMLLLLHLDPLDIRAERAYRLQVKERIYRFNFDALQHLEAEDRLEKLDLTFQSVKEGYLQTMSNIKAR